MKTKRRPHRLIEKWVGRDGYPRVATLSTFASRDAARAAAKQRLRARPDRMLWVDDEATYLDLAPEK